MRNTQTSFLQMSLLMVCALLTSGLTQAEEIHIGSIHHAMPRLIVTQGIMEHIYQRLGLTMILVKFPPKRSLIEVNNGAVNGELARATVIEANNPNLIRIPYRVGTIKLMAIQRAQQPDIKHITELKGMRIGVLRGFRTTESVTDALPREMYNDISGLFKGVIHGRIDVALFTKIGGEQFIRENQLEDTLVISEQPLIDIPIYHYLHNRAKQTAQALTAEMQKMQTSGELQALIKAQEQHYIDGRN